MHKDFQCCISSCVEENVLLNSSAISLYQLQNNPDAKR